MLPIPCPHGPHMQLRVQGEKLRSSLEWKMLQAGVSRSCGSADCSEGMSSVQAPRGQSPLT